MTERKAEATIGGKHLIQTSPVVWRMTEGVSPSVSTFDIAPADALELYAKRGPLELRILPVEGTPVLVKNLWVLNVLPGPNPYVSRVVVADRRWFWPYAHVLLRMNMRRNVGIKRILANDQFAVEFDRAPDVAFWKWSLENGNRRFVALNMLKKVFDQVSDAEKEGGGEAVRWKVDDRVGSKIGNLPIEELQIDDPGDAAVLRAIQALPEAGVTVDYDGTVIIFSKAAGDENEIVKALMPEMRDEGHTDLVKNGNIRPREIHVYFTREVELRFDFVEVARAVGATVTALEDLRRMENVLPISDYQLLVSEIDAKRALCQGTWITVDQGFRSWGTLPIPGTAKKLDHALVQRAFIPQMDLWAALRISGERPNKNAELINWTGRIAALQNHYRQTFRINSRWMDRIISLREYRLATIDPQSGQRGPACAYGDYCILYTQRSVWRNHADGKPLDYAINRSAFPTGGNLDSTVQPTPAVVHILDHDQGIVHLDYRGTDPLSGDTRTILPSQMAEDAMPTWDLRQRTRPISFDTVVKGHQPPRLSPSFKLAIVLSAVPASPNSKQQLHKVVVKPNEVAGLLPPAAAVGLGEAKGPPMEIRIGANVEVARIRWDDAKAVEIERIFGLTDGEPNLDGLVLNEGPSTNLERGGSINLIARAAAARLYASLADRYEGEMAAHMNGGVHLSGHVGEIVHEYGTRAETVTRVTFPPKIAQMSLLSFLDSNTRAAILRLVQPEP